MPSFSGFVVLHCAKGASMIDGETFETDASTGHTVPVIPSTYTAFAGVPVRSTTGVWSVTMRDPAFRVILALVVPLVAAANGVDVIMQPCTLSATGQQIINWTFVTTGTKTPADIGTSEFFQVTSIYSETSIP
jgi:hypothetical protein